MSSSPTMEAAPPHVQLVQMAMGHWISRIVYVAAELELADRLAGGPESAEELPKAAFRLTRVVPTASAVSVDVTPPERTPHAGR
jgi:hypothetical protein